MEIILFFVAHWYISLFCQTFFHHRYAAHRMFTMSPFWEKVFYTLSFVGQGSSFLSPRAYTILHRMHHAYADTDKDPHSPKYDSNLFTMMWRTKTIYNQILKNQTEIEPRFTKDVPNWPLMEKIGDHWFSRLGWIGVYTFFYLVFATSAWWFLLLPVHFIMGPVQGMVVNWFAHKYGYINFKMKDTSRNLFPLDIIMLGESLHNNHHKYGGRANFGVKWFEFDPVYYVIKFFNAIGIIQLKKKPA
jgi:stearoyl-CoA desaturase (Delta-9 desaturase)